jgi:hypothetical protein
MLKKGEMVAFAAASHSLRENRKNNLLRAYRGASESHRKDFGCNLKCMNEPNTQRIVISKMQKQTHFMTGEQAAKQHASIEIFSAVGPSV